MTNVGMQTTTYQVEDRSWLLSPHGTDPGSTPGVTLDVSKFTAGTHFPNGYIPSGTVLGVVTASSMYGPYDDAAVDGRNTAVGILFSKARVTLDNGTNATKAYGAILKHGVVSAGRLPFQSGTGFADANGKADLKLIDWRA